MRCYLIVVLTCISLMINDVEHLLVLPVGHLYVFGKMSIQLLCPFLNQFFGFFVFAIKLYEFFIYFGY